MPLIFAMTILQVPGMIGQFWPKGKFNTFVSTYLSPATTNIAGIIIYYVLYAIMIVGFAYFYSSITFNPVEISKNLQQNGGFIPGIRPGRPTSDYLQKKCSRLTMFGALFLDDYRNHPHSAPEGAEHHRAVCFRSDEHSDYDQCVHRNCRPA